MPIPFDTLIAATLNQTSRRATFHSVIALGGKKTLDHSAIPAGSLPKQTSVLLASDGSLGSGPRALINDGNFVDEGQTRAADGIGLPVGCMVGQPKGQRHVCAVRPARRRAHAPMTSSAGRVCSLSAPRLREPADFGGARYQIFPKSIGRGRRYLLARFAGSLSDAGLPNRRAARALGSGDGRFHALVSFDGSRELVGTTHGWSAIGKLDPHHGIHLDLGGPVSVRMAIVDVGRMLGVALGRPVACPQRAIATALLADRRRDGERSPLKLHALLQRDRGSAC